MHLKNVVKRGLLPLFTPQSVYICPKQMYNENNINAFYFIVFHFISCLQPDLLYRLYYLVVIIFPNCVEVIYLTICGFMDFQIITIQGF